MGVRVIMLSGDRPEAAHFIAKQIGIDEVIAGVLPNDKLRIIERIRWESRAPVAMVGDGINDAPALASADVGIAIGAGTDIAVEAGDVTLVGDRLSGVVLSFVLSRYTLRVIRQNLFWAFFYNVLGIPLAAGLFYPFLGISLTPTWAAGAMAASSVSVVSNALRLRWIWKRWKRRSFQQ
jgi:P-type E1-E2 ATPase